VGTGPFIVTDYVSGSSITFEKNPNYWNNDPLFPENRLPYLDSVKALIIPDRSTYIAAFRAGKLDIAHFRWLEEVEPLRGVPGIVEVPFLDNSPWSVSLKTDDPALPTYDLNVRRALSLAVNRQEVLETLFKGEATLMPFPGRYPELMGIYTPFEELTEAAKYSYRYDPEEAKQLLAEAGYPNGFKIEILTDPGNQEMAAVIAGYWAQIGVEATLDQREASVRWSMQKAKTWKDAFANGRPDGLHISRMSDTIPGGIWNCSNLDDPEVNALMEKVRSVFHDTKLQHAALKEYAVKALVKVPWVMLPLEYRYNLHWDWVKNYNGAFNLDYQKYGRFTEFSWVDQDRKFELIGQR
jgi:peptide/nickel transport system substrate-binding protein